MKIRILFFLLLSVNLSFTQGNIFNEWYFGLLAGLDFNGSVTAVSDGQINTSEGTASICDENGVLLFYTEGVNVWNRNHNLMPNGTGLTGNVSTSQSALIVQLPGSTTLYYLFTVPPDEGGDLSYSIVDMTLDGGMGDIVAASKNTAMPNRAPITTEKITAVRHCNGIDWWIITHDQSGAGSSDYRVWLFSATGVNATPVVTSVGTPVTTSSPLINHGYGWMTATNDGTMLVLAHYGQDVVDIVDFDNATGIVSNVKSMPGIIAPYGTEFSPDDQLLYIASGDQLLQFNPTLPTAADILASQQLIATEPNGDAYRAIRMGPDGIVYVTVAWKSFLGTISSPNTPGSGCNYNEFGMDISLGGTNFAQTALGLPNNYKFGNPCGPAGILASFTPSQTTICAGECITFTDNSSGTGITGWTWQFPGGVPTGSLNQDPGTVCFNASGTHSVTLTVTDGTNSDDTTIAIIVNPLPNVIAVANPSTVICRGDSVSLSGTGAATYVWNNGVTNGSSFAPSTTTTYVVTGTAANTCQNADSITIMVSDCEEVVEIIGVPQAFSPNNDGNNDLLFVKGSGIKTMSFQVYNRYGQKVFETDNQVLGWDGKFNGKEENPGVFVWVLNYTYVNSGGGVMKGNTTLIR